MARRVYLHIGLPKTGTTYLQGVLWSHREQLRDQGVLLPGRGHREHLWASLDAQERGGLARRHRDAPGSWDRLVTELAEWPDTGLVSHEFFSGAGRNQVERLVEQLAPAEVHVVVTARHTLAMLTAGWQEYVKNGGTQTPAEVVADEKKRSEFGWRTWDLGGVLRRWAGSVAPEHVHVLPLPGRGDPPEQHWTNFASVLGLTGDFELPDRAANQSLGLAQVEVLRRVNAELEGFTNPTDRGRWIRTQLAETWLAPQGGEAFTVEAALVDDCRRRAEAAVDMVRRRGFTCVGDVERLLVPADLPSLRTPEDVDDSELVKPSARLVAVMLAALRDTSRELGALRRQSDSNASPSPQAGP